MQASACLESLLYICIALYSKLQKAWTSWQPVAVPMRPLKEKIYEKNFIRLD
jgi:hypothetical protein